jgi:hypothetical protein
MDKTGDWRVDCYSGDWRLNWSLEDGLKKRLEEDLGGCGGAEVCFGTVRLT